MVEDGAADRFDGFWDDHGDGRDVDGFDLERYRDWVEGVREEIRLRQVTGVAGAVDSYPLHVPDWHRRRRSDRPTHGTFSDQVWAVTVRPNPRYL